MLMKDYSISGRSKLLLLTLFALLIGASPTWAQKSLPYSYGFEDNNLATDGWTTANPGNNNSSKFLITSSVKNTGSYGFQFSSYDGGTANQLLISPELNAPSGGSLSFYYKSHNSGSYYTESFRVGYSTSGTDADNFTWGDVISENSGTWKKYENDFPAGTKYIAVNYTSNNKYYLYVDDFSFAAPPTCIKPTNLATSNITSNSVTLSWASTGEEWNVQYKKATDEGWTDVSSTVTTNPYTLTGLTASTAYQVRVRTYCDSSDQSEWTEAVSFTTDCGAISEFPYTENFNGISSGIPMCWNNTEGTTSTESYKWNYFATGHDGACVRFNSYNNYSGNTNMLKTPVMNFTSGKAMQLVFWYKNPTAGDFSVYISNDGGATYTTELATGLTGASAWTKKEIILPNGFTENVVIVFQGTSNYGSGDAYIYLDDVTVQEAPSCIVPTGLTITNITSSGATLSWTSDADDFNVRYKKASDSDWTEVSGTISAKTHALTGLTPATSYQVQVRTYCSASDQSVWTDAESFTTDCVAVTEFPFTENFNGITAGIPLCWNNAEGTTTNDAYKWNYYATGHDGACVRFESLYNPTNYTNMLKSPVMNFPSGKTMQLTFWYKNPKAGDFSVYISSDGGATYTTALATGLTNQSSWEKKEIILPAGFSENVVIVFKGTSNYSSGDAYIYLDDVTIDEAPACIVPTELAASNATANSVELSWINGSDEEAWQIAYGTTADFDADAATPVDATTNPFTLTGLSAKTTYYVCVRSKKDSDVSVWSEKISFTTQPSCIVPTDFAISSLSQTSATLTWADATTQSKWEVSYSTTSGDYSTVIPVTEKTYTITGLTTGTTYYASVRAVNSEDDKSEWSTEISFTPGIMLVNDGTETNGYVPIYGYDCDGTDVKSQFIIPAETLGAIGNSEISKLIFHSSASSKSWGNATFDVYLKNITESEFATTDFVDWDSMDKVYSGSLAVSNYQMTIELPKEFEYTGGNLLVGFAQTAKGSSSSVSWYGVSTTNNAAVAGSSYYNYRTFLPKMSVFFTPVELGPKMVLSTDALDFGMVSPDATEEAKQLTFTIKNKGKSDMTDINVSCEGDAFTTTEVSDATIAVGGEYITVTVTINTENPGDYAGTITVSAASIESQTINVSGTVLDPTKMFEDFAGNALPDFWTTKSIGSNAGSWNFANGYAQYIISGYANYLNNYKSALVSPEEMTFTDNEKVKFMVKKDKQYDSYESYLLVQYTADGTTWTDVAEGAFNTADLPEEFELKEATIPGTAKQIRFVACGVSIDNIYGGTLPSGARFAINTDGTTQDFGFVEQNAEAEKTYTITNDGSSDLYLSLDAPEGFSIEGGNALLFTSNKGWNSVYVHAWNGKGDLTTWPGNPATYVGKNGNNEDQYAFIVPEGATGIVIDNGGTEQTQDINNFDVTGYYLTGDLYDGNKYWAESWGTAPSALKVAAGGSETFTVKMSTEATGQKSGNVKLAFQAIGQTEFTIPVTGYVLDTDAILVDFDGNQLPDGWTKSSSMYIYGNEIYTNSYVQSLTSPSITVAEGEKLMIYARGTATAYAELNVQTSTDNGATWTTAKTFTTELRTGTSNKVILYVDNIAAGNYKLRFYGDYFGIDIINGYHYNQEAPALGVTLAGTNITTGYNDNFGLKVKAQPEAHTYTIKNTGTGTLTGTITSSVTDHFTVSESEFSLGKDETLDFDLSLVFDENYGEKASAITIHPANAGLADIVINASATTKDPNIWEEDFENGMPAFWTTTGWTVSSPYYGGNGTKVIGPGNNTTATLTTPRLQATEGQKLKFDVIGAESEYYSIKMQYSTDDQETWSEIVTYTDAGTKEFIAPADGLYYLRFTGNYTYLDNFEGFKLALPDHIMAITASNIPTSGSYSPTMKATKSFTATVTVKESRGVAEENVIAKLYMGDEVIGTSEATSFAANESKVINITATPTVAATEGAEMHIEVEYAGGTLKTDVVTRYVAELVRLDMTDTSEPTIETGYSAVYDVVTLTRSFVAGWNTFVAPLAVAKSEFGEGAKFYSFTGYADGALKFSTVTGETLNPATPYIIYVPAAIAEKVFTWESPVIYSSYVGTENIKVTDVDATFQGTYAPIAAPNMEGKWGVTSEARIAKGTDEASIKGFRAYFELPDGANGARLSFYDDATGITTVIGADELNDDKAYNLGGQRVQNPKKGLYIINGKKVVIK